ncbi:MAG TPA: protein-glutamine glutaminase family protein [Flavobacteriales bacterium]|nr:protein-glutamine glutaminase family protein [Flavobacteriales bacterium]
MHNNNSKTRYSVVSFAGILLSLFILNGCGKQETLPELRQNTSHQANVNNHSNGFTRVMTVGHVQTDELGNSRIAFIENPQVFTTSNALLAEELTNLKRLHVKAKVTFDPYTSSIIEVTTPSVTELMAPAPRTASKENGISMNVDLTNLDEDALDNAERLGVMTHASGSLMNVVPDMATAQLMFNYITQQCCALPSPYDIDHCISFQYAYDGCYARAHKMCYIINKKYGYNTHKIFSFANSGWDVLSVQAQKWGGCCINWWYHVAPLVNIKTPAGVKAYVFDPAMFDQPVLLSVWLHFQEHPACASTPNVSMINIQPTAMYAPSDYSGYSFMTDPGYIDTDATLIYYGSTPTCP